LKKKLSSLLLIGAITLGSVGVADAASSFVKAYLVKSSVSVDGKKVSSNVYQINKDYYISAKSLKTASINSSVSSSKVAVTNKLTPTVTSLQNEVKVLKANIEKLTVGEDKAIELTTGFYEVGLNLPEGTYKIESKSGVGGVSIYNSHEMLIVNEMMDYNHEYGTNIINNVVLDKGSKIQITGDHTLTFTKKF